MDIDELTKVQADIATAFGNPDTSVWHPEFVRAVSHCRDLLAEVERLTKENYYLAHDPHSELLTAREQLAKVTAERDALRAAAEAMLGDWTNVKARDRMRAVLRPGIVWPDDTTTQEG